jgi:hypothetical protein
MDGPRVPDDRRRLLLRAALGFLQLPPRGPELRLLHRWLDTWTGLSLVVVSVERQGLRFSLSHIAKGERRAYFMSNPRFAPEGFGVATTPSLAVQRAAVKVGASSDQAGVSPSPMRCRRSQATVVSPLGRRQRGGSRLERPSACGCRGRRTSVPSRPPGP